MSGRGNTLAGKCRQGLARVHWGLSVGNKDQEKALEEGRKCTRDKMS